MNIVMLAYPGMTPLDLMGPLQVWSQIPGVNIQVVWKVAEPIQTDTGMCIVPTHTLAEAHMAPDVLFVPGGTKATTDLMSDVEVIDFLKLRGAGAKWITSVCTGALVLGAAGLLEGYKATTHWAAKAYLPALGAIATEGRYVIDRNRATGGGVTAGIDFGLAMVAALVDETTAMTIQLVMEYSPEPPFNAGTPEDAPDEIVKLVVDGFAEQVS